MVHYVSPPVAALPSYSSFEGDESYFLHHFSVRTGPDLAGVHNSEFWLRYVFQIAVAEPAIKHAVIALSALHRQFQLSSDMSLIVMDLTYPLRQYTRSLTVLVQSMQSPSWGFQIHH